MQRRFLNLIPALRSGGLALAAVLAPMCSVLAEDRNPSAPPGLIRYEGRRIAQTMHFLGAPWLMRDSRGREEDSQKLLGALRLKAGMSVCDMGCGNGFYTIPLAEAVGPTGRVFAVDIQSEMLRLLEDRLQARDIQNVKPVLGTPVESQLPSESVDLVLCVDVYHEFSHPVHMLDSMRRALRPQGVIAVVEFRAEDPGVPIKRLHKMTKSQVTREWSANGMRLVRTYDELPWQHVLFFARAKSGSRQHAVTGRAPSAICVPQEP